MHGIESTLSGLKAARGDRLAWIILAIAAILTVTVYWTGLSGPFLLDDNHNLDMARAESVGDLIPTILGNTSGRLGRPVSALTFALNALLGDGGTFGYKAVNLSIHLVNGLLIFLLGGRLLTRMAPNGPAPWTVAAVAASLWLLHPLNVSTVLYAVQRMTELSALFTLGGLLCYLAGRERLLAGSRGALPLMTAAILVFTPLAVLSKENGALLPVFVLLVEAVAFRFAAPAPEAKRRLLRLLGLTCALPVALGLLYGLMRLDSLLGGYAIRSFGLGERLLTQAHVLPFYLRLILLPRLSAMNLYHDDFPITRELDAGTAGIVLAFLVVIAAAVALARRAPLLAFGVGWFLIAHLLESTIFPLELVFEHRNYLASWGVLLPVVWAGGRLLDSPLLAPRIRPLLAIAVLLIFTLLTGLRAQTWSSLELFAFTSYLDRPNSARANTQLAEVYFRSGDMSLGRERLAHAAKLLPREPGPVLFEVFSHCHDGPPPRELIEAALTRLRNFPLTPYGGNTIYNLHKAHLDGDCPGVDAETILEFTSAVLDSGQRDGKILFSHGSLLGFLGDYDGAIPHLRAAFDESRSLPMRYRIPALFILADVQSASGRFDDAAATIALMRELNARADVNIDGELPIIEEIYDHYRTSAKSP